MNSDQIEAAAIDNMAELSLLYAVITSASEANQDAPDGAYYEILCDTVRFWNQDHGTDYDEYHVVNGWFSRDTVDLADEDEEEKEEEG